MSGQFQSCFYAFDIVQTVSYCPDGFYFHPEGFNTVQTVCPDGFDTVQTVQTVWMVLLLSTHTALALATLQPWKHLHT